MRARLFVVVAVILSALPVAAYESPLTITSPLPDGTALSGDLWPTGRKGSPLVIALPGGDGDRRAWRPIVERFQKAGIEFFALDLPGGEPAYPDMHGYVEGMKQTLVARGADGNRIGLLGSGFGGAVALDCASRNERFRAACLLTPRTGYHGLPTLTHLTSWWERPLLVYSSRKNAGKGPKEIAKRGGGELRVKDPKGREEEYAAWFAETLGAPVALDGKLSKAEKEGGRTVEMPWEADAKLTIHLRTAGPWLHVALVPEKGGAPADMDFAWTRDPDFDSARAVMYSDATQAFTHRIMRKRKWSPMRRNPAPGQPRVGAARGKVIEMLLPLGEKPLGLTWDPGIHFLLFARRGIVEGQTSWIQLK